MVSRDFSIINSCLFTFCRRLSLSKTSNTPRAAAHEIGEAPNVLPIPASWTESIILDLPTTAARGKPPPIPLAKVTISGSTFTFVAPNISPVLPNPVWTSSKINKMLCFLVISLSFLRNPLDAGMYPPSPSWISTTIAAISLGSIFFEIKFWSCFITLSSDIPL